MAELPVLRRAGERAALFVDGRPFIILGLQWDCDSCSTPEVMNPLFAQAARIGCNTASLLLAWRLVEPEEGRFDFSILDTMLEQARDHRLRIVLVWFGAFKNGCLNYAPDWVKADRARFRRVRDQAGEEIDNFACPNCEELRKADLAALTRVLARLAEVDEQRTVILFQLENEVGLQGTARCHCPACSAEFERDRWAGRLGDRAEEAFSAHSLARYLEAQAAELRSVYPIPLHINATLDVLARCSRPGVAKQYSGTGLGTGYLSGTPIERVFDIYRSTLEHVDFVSPDIYQHSRRDFLEFCRLYSWPGKALYISEHSSGPGSRAERNLFYAIGCGAIGFDPWAIDRCHPASFALPLAHPLDGRLSGEALALRDSYRVIADAMAPIAAAQGTPALQAFVQEDQEQAAKLRFEAVTVEVSYNDPRGATRGVVVQTEPEVFVIAGIGAGVGFCDGQGRPIAIASAERGRFAGDRWTPLCPVRREGNDPAAPVHLVVPQVLRIRLDGVDRVAG